MVIGMLIQMRSVKQPYNINTEVQIRIVVMFYFHTLSQKKRKANDLKLILEKNGLVISGLIKTWYWNNRLMANPLAGA